MKRNSKLLISGIATLAGFILLFQNCSATQFSALSSEGYEVFGNEVVETLNASTMSQIDKVDILFVLDESSSMTKVATEVATGFRSLAAGSLPDNTRFAVTNTAPAAYTSATAFNPDVSWASLLQSSINGSIVAQPGFLKLVNASSISHFITSYPTFATKFPAKGCSNSWFSLSDTGPDGISCLIAATNISLIGIGAEVGTISLEQLALQTKSRSERLFREGALANVIFVSDTHDPGIANYYGSNGAPTTQRKPAELLQTLTSANPNLLGLKFHGIVPLPMAGDPHLQGVNVAGALPPDNKQVLSELPWDYAYLPFIRDTGGIAVHVANTNWNSVLDSVAQASKIASNPVVRLRNTVTHITYVQVNGIDVPPSQYTLIDGGTAIQILANPSWPPRVTVTVRYPLY